MTRRLPLIFVLVLCPLVGRVAVGELRIGDICRVRGQEEITLNGLGLVVGLSGTGDGETPTTRALAKMMELMGTPVSTDPTGTPLLEELENAKNVALVFVSATVPAEGARRGNRLNCTVNAIGAKSLEGGYLMPTPLLGPRPGDPLIYGYGEGLMAQDRGGPPTSARIHDGCRLEADFASSYLEDGKITLILNKNHTSFHTAYDIEDALNGPQTFGSFASSSTSANTFPESGGGPNLSGDVPPIQQPEQAEPIAKALDQVNIEVRILPAYLDRPVQFVHEVLSARIFTPQNHATVVINERNGVIVIGDNVEVGSVAVTHKNLSIQTGADTGPLHILDQMADTTTTKLQALVDALNALKVETNDIIDIIKELERGGHLFGHVIVQ